MLVAVYLPAGALALMLGAIAWGIALRWLHLGKRNAALAALERYDGGRPNVPGLLRAARGLALPGSGGPAASPIDPTERAVWIRYVLEELSQGWNEVFSEASPAEFRLSLGGDVTVLVHANLPKLVLLRSGASAHLGELFDDESPEELAQCSPELAARVEAERASREALFRLRVERILEGESVYVAGVVGEGGDSLHLDERRLGTALASVPETELTERPSAWRALALAVVGLLCMGLGFWLLRLFTRA